jgi:hypothetical protein
MTVRNSVELVELISNQLGWAPPLGDTRPWHKVRTTEAAKLNRAIAKDPKSFTYDNLELAVEYMRGKKITPASTLAVCSFVKPALRESNQVEERPLGDLIDAAIARENELQRPEWTYWCRRLANAVGPYRQQVLDEWREARS